MLFIWYLNYPDLLTVWNIFGQVFKSRTWRKVFGLPPDRKEFTLDDDFFKTMKKRFHKSNALAIFKKKQLWFQLFYLSFTMGSLTSKNVFLFFTVHLRISSFFRWEFLNGQRSEPIHGKCNGSTIETTAFYFLRYRKSQ